MRRLIAAVLVGYVLIGVLVVTTDHLFAALAPGFKTMAQPPFYYFAISLATDFLYSMIGGYVCSLIARARNRQATVALILFGEAIGIASQVALWKITPHWFAIGLLILYPIAVWAGSRLHSPLHPVAATK